MAWRSAPAVKAALREATQRWPGRNRAADGTIGDLAHSNRTSDHNPDERGVVLAFDLTDDPGCGCDAHALVMAAVARRDRRIKYAISNGRIWSKARADEGWRPYTGSNKHSHHVHVSVDRRYENDTSPWWPQPEPPEPPPTTTAATEDDDMRLVHAPDRPLCLLRGDGRLWPLQSNDEGRAYEAAGVDLYTLTADQWDRLDAVSKRIGAVR